MRRLDGSSQGYLPELTIQNLTLNRGVFCYLFVAELDLCCVRGGTIASSQILHGVRFGTKVHFSSDFLVSDEKSESFAEMRLASALEFRPSLATPKSEPDKG